MNILIVDDQKSITESIDCSIDWKRLGIKEHYVANSAKEAKLVLMNFDVDILLTDIEMPEEDGLSLFKWTKEKYSGIVGVFLTSHADFSYAREAIKLGGFDYILQPARYEEIEATLERAIEEAKKTSRIKKWEAAGETITAQRDATVDLVAIKKENGENKEACELLINLRNSMSVEYENPTFKYLFVDIIHLDNRKNNWNDSLIKLVFRNVLEEIFSYANAKCCIGKGKDYSFGFVVALEEDKINIDDWNKGLGQFEEFFNARMGIKIRLTQSQEDMAEAMEATDENTERMKKSIEYMKTNISHAISRTEVADYVHLNEDYFSRQFKKYTGYTFKDYDLMLRMDMAKKLLEQTRLSISLIAPKVGYDNFSHFSKVFKKYTDMTPQEYRKVKSGM